MYLLREVAAVSMKHVRKIRPLLKNYVFAEYPSQDENVHLAFYHYKL